MARRFTAGIAAGILILGLTGGVGAAPNIAANAAASPSGTTAAAHSVASGGTRQVASQQGRASGEQGASLMVVNGGDLTVTAVNGQMITATSNGLGIMGGQIIAGGQSVADGPGAVGGKGASSGTIVSGGPGAAGAPGPGLVSTSPVTMTITVSASTVYTRAEHAASLSDVQVGSVLHIEGTSTGATTLTASTVEIVLPQRSGVVTAVNGATLTVTGFDARTYSIVEDSSTVYHRAGQAAAQSDITVGSLISAEGTVSGNGSTVNALAVTIQLPRVFGQVTAVSGDTVTVQGPDGTASTVRLTGTTTYSAGPKATADKSSVVSGTLIMAEGTLGSDGSLTAVRVDIGPGKGIGGSMSWSISVSGGDAITSNGPTF